ncbi:hypothetical protein EV214_13625 [Marinisporobacter balticus]|uniref:Uncharacterized protein n=2 Tax=Marinisporobacter balticus TaxID=2018667 RepID=A0A4R2KF95_9FIRM|nr:hypothetical protein EV214_13625 [Marinisporobacter balticus]
MERRNIAERYVKFYGLGYVRYQEGEGMRNEMLRAIMLGVGAGVIDILPMILKKMDRFSVISAFIHWVALGVIISYSSVFGLTGWSNGALIGLLTGVPVAIMVMKEDQKSVPIIIVMSLILGSIVGYLA